MRLVVGFSFIILLIFLFPLCDISINSYFSQDDFFHLRLIIDKNILDIPSFFVNRLEGQTFYRPLSRETFNLIAYKTFGLNPLPFHLFNLSLIIFNTLLIFILIKKISTFFIMSIITAILYGLSAIHSIELYYLASVQTLLATCFVLASVYFYLQFLKNRNTEAYLASVLLFLLALLSHESAIILPGLLLMIEIFMPGVKFSLKKTVKRLLLFSSLGLIYLISIATLFSLPKQEVYQPVFSINSIGNTLMWYSLWSLNFPEMLVDFMGSNFNLNPNFIKWYGDYALICLLLFLFIILTSFLFIISFKKKIFKNKILYLFFFCYLISLSPFLFFPRHKFVYYLSLPSFWILAILAFILSVAWQRSLLFKILSLLTILSFGMFSYQTIRLNQQTHWAAKRAVAAKSVLELVHKTHPNVANGTIFYMLDDPNYPEIAKEWGTSSKQAFYILSGSDALKLLYRDSSIETYYQAIGGLPKGIDKKRVISFTAKFPY